MGSDTKKVWIMAIKIGDKFVYVPGGIYVEVYDILRGGGYIELADDLGQIITVVPSELDGDDYRKLG